MEKNPQTKKNTKPKLSRATLHTLFVNPGAVAVRKGEKVRGFAM